MIVKVQDRKTKKIGVYDDVIWCDIYHGCLRIQMRNSVTTYLPLRRVNEWQEIR